MSFVIQHACLACFRSQYVSLLHSALILMHLFVFEKSLSVLCAIVSSKRRSCVADTWKLFDRCNCFVRSFSICFAVLTSSFFRHRLRCWSERKRNRSDDDDLLQTAVKTHHCSSVRRFCACWTWRRWFETISAARALRRIALPLPLLHWA